MICTVGNDTTLVDCKSRKEVTLFEARMYPHMHASVPGARYTWQFKKKLWDGKVTLWDKESHPVHEAQFTVKTGLVPRIINTFSPSIRDRRKMPKSPTLKITKLNARPYQAIGVATAFGHSTPGLGWFPRGVIKVPPGGGKTEMAVMMYEMNPIPSMFLVHTKDLLKQAYDRFNQYGHSPGRIGDGKFDVGNITIATMQTLHRGVESGDPRLVKLFKATQQLFLDEAHLMASDIERGNMFCRLVDNYESAYCRWGLTGTPFMRSQYDNLLLESVTGPLLYEVSSSYLVEQGYLTKPNIKFVATPFKINVTKKKKERSGDYWRNVQAAGIRLCDKRNKLVAEEVIKAPTPCLCLVTTVEQGNEVQRFINQMGGNIQMISGKDSSAIRSKAIKDLRTSKIDRLMTTTIFDEGVDVPELMSVILASGGKSKQKLIQRVGRGARTSSGKNSVLIVDFEDTHHELLRRHALERKRHYKEEGYV